MKNQNSKLFKRLKSSAAPCCVALTVIIGACNADGTRNNGDTTLISSDSVTNAESVSIKPSGPKPQWAPDIKPEMQAVIEKLASYDDKPIPELTPQEARKNHTPTDAVMDLIKENNIQIPPSTVDTAGREIPVKGGNIHIRVYTPKGEGPFPVIVYYHGGGFVIADLDVYDASANSLAQQTSAVVVSVAYRLGPENKFPVAHDDSFAAYEWVVKNTASINGNPKMIAVAGESAGGNLSMNMAIMARDKGIKQPVHILCVYPIAQSDTNTPSYIKNAAAKPLSKPMMEWFNKHYLNNIAEAKDPRISLVMANLKALPPTTIITAGIDPLQSDGMMLEEKLKAAGVEVQSKNYAGATHEFFGMAAIVPEAKEAQAYAVSQLKKAFDNVNKK